MTVELVGVGLGLGFRISNVSRVRVSVMVGYGLGSSLIIWLRRIQAISDVATKYCICTVRISNIYCR